jgi:hypothetical protein
METYADTSAFNAAVKEKNMKTNKITKSGKNPKCSFFITKSAVEPKNE